MRSLIAALMLSAAIIGISTVIVPPPPWAVAALPTVVRIAPIKEQDRHFRGDAVPWFTASQLSFEFACSAVYAPLEPNVVRPILYHSD